MSSCTGILSTTASDRPAASIWSASSERRGRGHTAPTGRSCSALTTPRTPGIWRMWASGMGSAGPNHRKVICIAISPGWHRAPRVSSGGMRWDTLDALHDEQKQHRAEWAHEPNDDVHRRVREVVDEVTHEEREQ